MNPAIRRPNDQAKREEKDHKSKDWESRWSVIVDGIFEHPKQRLKKTCEVLRLKSAWRRSQVTKRRCSRKTRLIVEMSQTS